MSGIAFEIRIRGLVDRERLDDLEDLQMTTASATTTVTGTAADQAALLGLLARLRAHGLVITELRRLEDAPPED